MASTSMMHNRVDDDLKARATEALAAVGLSTSEAVRLFLRRVVIEGGLPLSLKVPNAETQAAMERARALKPEDLAYTNLREMIRDVEKAAGRAEDQPAESDFS